MAALLISRFCTHLNRLNNHNSFRLLLRKFAVVSSQPSYLFFNSGFDDESEKIEVIEGMKVYEGFLSETEESSLLQELEPYLKRLRYERDHWDNAIKGFRETERTNWNPANREVIERVKGLAFKENSVPLRHVHILDLEENGVIMPHIDSIKFCGTTIAGLSLLSDSVMRLVHDKNKNKVVDVLLKRCSLYIMTKTARYDYTHEILANENSKFNDQVVKKTRRISVICRNEP